MAWFIPQNIPLPPDFVGFAPEGNLHDAEFHQYTRHLPHWRKPGACYISTFRLRDSLPAEIVAQMKAEEQEWQQHLAEAALKNAGRLPADEWAAWQEFQRMRLRKLDLLLDKGHGECLLRDPEHRVPLMEAFHHFEGVRVEMLAYAIMPNHAHTLCRPLPGHELESLTGSWKRVSSQRIHRAMGRTGPLWQDESWDRIIRDAEHYSTAVRYIAKNPLVAHLNESEATVWLHPSMLCQ